MARDTTASFICEVPLKATPADERELLIRLECARMVYNACLGTSLRRLKQLHESRAFQDAKKLPKGIRGSEAAKKRTEAFRKADEGVGFREYDLHAYAKQFGQTWVGINRLDSLTIQKMATRAFRAAQEYHFGGKGKPRFKGKGWFDSVEGKTNTSGIRWQTETQTVVWLGLTLPAIIKPEDKVIAHGLTCRVKFVRIVRRKLNKRTRFYAQLICEGPPYQKEKNELGQGVTGIDIGPSTLATVTDESATLEHFCEELEPIQPAIRKLQRKLDRQRRAGDPQNYNPNGTIKKGVKLEWHFSKRYVYTREQLAELRRKQAAYRKSLHGRKVNQILAQGNIIKLEKLSYRAFQKMYGKSVGFRGPGTFVALLRRKAANAGAAVDEFSTQTTRLSQVCLCGAIAKKPLSLRWHVCDCGVGPIQRDIFSAWLARYVVNNKLDAGQAQAAWPGADSFLRAASSEVQPAMGQGQPKPNRVAMQVARGQSRSSVPSGECLSEACHGEVVAVTRKLALQPEPPAFRDCLKSQRGGPFELS
jgi:putative transposase